MENQKKVCKREKQGVDCGWVRPQGYPFFDTRGYGRAKVAKDMSRMESKEKSEAIQPRRLVEFYF